MPSSKPLPEVVIGELIVDVYWSVEMQVEEHLHAAKAALSVEPETSGKQVDGVTSCPSATENHSDDSILSLPLVERKRRAEIAKEVLCEFLRQLLVSSHSVRQKYQTDIFSAETCR